MKSVTPVDCDNPFREDLWPLSWLRYIPLLVGTGVMYMGLAGLVIDLGLLGLDLGYLTSGQQFHFSLSAVGWQIMTWGSLAEKPMG